MLDKNKIQMLRALINRAKNLSHEIAILIILNINEYSLNEEKHRRVHLKQRASNRNKANNLIRMFRSAGFYVECFNNEIEFMKKALDGYIDTIPHKHKFVHSTGAENTGPGFRALVPAFCNRIGLKYMNSNAHTRSLVWHKYHNTTILEHLGIPVPKTWQYDYQKGWANGRKPPKGIEIISKNSYEAWAIGVDEEAIMYVDEKLERYLKLKSSNLYQPLIVQEFIEGREIYCPIIDVGEKIVPDVLEVKFNQKELCQRNIQTFKDNIMDDAIGFTSINNEKELCERVVNEAINTMEALEINCISRIDFRIDRNNNLFIFDVAEIPSFHSKHAFSIAFKNCQFGGSDLVTLMIASNLIQYRIISRDSPVL